MNLKKFLFPKLLIKHEFVRSEDGLDTVAVYSKLDDGIHDWTYFGIREMKK